MDSQKQRRIVIAGTKDTRALLVFKFEHANFAVSEVSTAKDVLFHLLDPSPADAAVIGDFDDRLENTLSLVTDLRCIFDADEMPIVVLSAHAFPHNRTDALAAGANEFIPMPFTHLDVVVKAVKQLLEAA